MALLIPNQGEQIILDLLVNKGGWSSENLVLRLFTSNTTPGETDTEATYTEATGNGYVSKTLTGASWTISAGAPSDASYAKQSWTFTGALGNVYGYYLTQVTSGDLVYAERFTDGPYNITLSGDIIEVTPTITMD